MIRFRWTVSVLRNKCILFWCFKCSHICWRIGTALATSTFKVRVFQNSDRKEAKLKFHLFSMLSGHDSKLVFCFVYCLTTSFSIHLFATIKTNCAHTIVQGYSLFVSFKFRHIFEFVSCSILICLMSVAISLLWSDWFFMLFLSRSACVSSSELAARHGSLNLNWIHYNRPI